MARSYAKFLRRNDLTAKLREGDLSEGCEPCGKMALKLISAVVLVGFLFLIDVPLPLLQSVAWAGMTIHHLQTAPLKVAIEKTVDGTHPCRFCKTIGRFRHGDKAELKNQMARPARPDLFRVAFLSDLHLVQVAQFNKQSSSSDGLNRKTPPFPPPKNLLA